MTTAAAVLERLHELHQKREDVQERLAAGPRKIRAADTRIAKCTEKLEAHREALQQAKMAADQKSLQLRTNEAKITELKVKLNACTSNREFDVIKSQIQADEMANSVLEDEILENLEKVDQMQSALNDFEESLAAAEKQKQEIVSTVESERAGLEEEAARLDAAIEETERDLPDNTRERYERLVRAKGAGAIARVENDFCSACNMGLEPQLRVESKAGQIVFCKSCGRMLYRSPDEE